MEAEHLHLGEEVFTVTENAVSSKQGLNQFVFARHQGMMEGTARLKHMMQSRLFQRRFTHSQKVARLVPSETRGEIQRDHCVVCIQRGSGKREGSVGSVVRSAESRNEASGAA